MIRVHKKNSQPLYESNYRKLVSMLPDISLFNHVTLSSDNHQINLGVDVLERTPYTILLVITTGAKSDSPFTPKTELQVRMYHDAKVAEVVMVQGIRNLNSYYDYPNAEGRLPDEKRQGNRLLAEMLSICHRDDYKKTYVPRPTEINN